MNGDLISRSALLQEAYEDYRYRATLEDWELDLLQNYLDAAPAVDAVEVVRCKDCKRWMKDVPGCTDFVGRCELANYMIGATGYCVHGERRADE